MALMHSTESVLGSAPAAFSLPGVDGKHYSLESFAGARALLVVFMCNHCPYVVAIHERLSSLARTYQPQGLAVIGINSNDPAIKEADSFPNMIKTSQEWNLPFPYVFDESQSVAKAYDAVCTPDPYLYQWVPGQGWSLHYRGRIDDSWKDIQAVKEQSLKQAIEAALSGRPFGKEMIPSMGCSIKWRTP